MAIERWLSLTEYSNKHRMSISTLRRRIRSNQIRFRLEHGKYELLDIPPSVDELPSASMTQEVVAQSMPAAQVASTAHEEPILSTASKLLNELKQAYSSILHEKEEQIIHLKGEAANLKTLVRALESDNERLKAILRGNHQRGGEA